MSNGGSRRDARCQRVGQAFQPDGPVRLESLTYLCAGVIVPTLSGDVLMIRRLVLLTSMLMTVAVPRAAHAQVDLGNVTEKHVMIPMRDGTKLSAYLYF